MGESILVAHGEAPVRQALHRALARASFFVATASTGHFAVTLASREQPSCVLVDADLPDLPGALVCKRLRAATSAVILVVASGADVATRCACLDQGADDCVERSISENELIARIRARLRRYRPLVGRTLRFADVEVDTEDRSARRGARRLALTPKELDLLELLVRRSRQIVPRQQIAEAVWRDAEGDRSRAIDVHVHHLRDKLHGPGEPALLHTIRGVGYVLRPSGPMGRGSSTPVEGLKVPGSPRPGLIDV